MFAFLVDGILTRTKYSTETQFMFLSDVMVNLRCVAVTTSSPRTPVPILHTLLHGDSLVWEHCGLLHTELLHERRTDWVTAGEGRHATGHHRVVNTPRLAPRGRPDTERPLTEQPLSRGTDDRGL